MAGYVIGPLKEIKDADALTAYQGAAGATVAQYGGKLVVSSNKIDTADGGWAPNAIVVLECESVEQARKWYHSPEYQSIVGQRINSADTGIIIVDGD